MKSRPETVLERRRVRAPAPHHALAQASACLWACAWLASHALADMYTVRRDGATIVPTRESTIIMDSEEVVIEPHEYGYRATAVFELRNPSDEAVSCTVAFPVAGSTLQLGRYTDFSIEGRAADAADGAWDTLAFEVKRGTADPRRWDSFARPAPERVADFTEAVVWEAGWAPRQTRWFRVRFDMGEPKYLAGTTHLASGTQLTYIVSTGALWAAPIGRARITIRTHQSDPQEDAFGPRNRRLVSYAEEAVWTSPTEVTWSFENWIPREEIWLRDVSWRGIAWADLQHYRYILPGVYRGAEAHYSAATIDTLVEEELSLAREYFPARIAIPLETKKLHVLIADWLLHEIYARHGDTFYLGPWDGKELPAGTVGIGDHSLHSSWYGRFCGYGWHGGWYKPVRPVRPSELSTGERQNAAFLIAYLAELRGSLPQEARDFQAPIHTPGLGPFLPKPHHGPGR